MISEEQRAKLDKIHADAMDDFLADIDADYDAAFEDIKSVFSAKGPSDEQKSQLKPTKEGFSGDETDSLGRKLHYVNGKRVSKGGDGSGDDVDSITPDDHKPQASKIRATFDTIKSVVYNKLVEGGLFASSMAPAILDTSEDYLNGKLSQYGDQQIAFREATGMSVGFAGTLAHHAIAAGFKLAKAYKARHATEGAENEFETAHYLTVYCVKTALEALGLPIEIDEDAIRKLLASKQTAKAQESLEATDADVAAYERLLEGAL